jgi:hypothetical protein
MKELLILSMVLAMAAVAPCAGETVYFVVARTFDPCVISDSYVLPLADPCDPCDPCVEGDSYVLPLADPCDIEDARYLVEYGPGGDVPSIVVAAIDHWDPNRINTNRDYLQPGICAWSWYVTEFLGFADLTPEILDGSPSIVEGNVQWWMENTGGFIGFWGYTVVAELGPTVVAELGPDLEPWNCNLDLDGDVDINDLTLFALHWLETGCGHRYWCGGADQNGSGMVNLKDFGIFCKNWDWVDGYGKAGMSYQIEDCDPCDPCGPGAKSTAGDKDALRFSVTVQGNYILFEDMMYANCCPDELLLEMTIEDDLITIYEIEHTTNWCDCMCDFPVIAMLGPFEPSTYTLEVYEDTSGFIGSTVVIIE